MSPPKVQIIPTPMVNMSSVNMSSVNMPSVNMSSGIAVL